MMNTSAGWCTLKYMYITIKEFFSQALDSQQIFEIVCLTAGRLHETWQSL